MLGCISRFVRKRLTRKPVKGGWFDVVCTNADGSVAWRESFPNGNTTGGMTNRLSAYFNSGTQITTWYLGLIDNASFSALSLADVMNSHAGWIENTDYNEAARVQWTPLSAASSSIVNTSVCAFTINASKTIYGIFLCSVSTKGGTTGILWATGAFSSPQALVSTQVLNVTYRYTDA